MAENTKKQIPLRLSAKLYNEIAAWGMEERLPFSERADRKYLLSECVRQRKKNGKYVSEELDKPLDIDIG